MDFNSAIKLLAEEQGWNIFPLRGKYPPKDFKWKQRRTNKVRELAWMEDEYDPDGAGIPTGADNDLLVVDIDVKDGKNGEQNFKEFCGEHTIPVTVVSRTASGGYHIYFKYPKGSGITVAKEVPCADVDIRGENGYVKAYDFVEGRSPHDIPIAECPQWLVDGIKNHRSRSDTSTSEIITNAKGKVIDGRDTVARDAVLDAIIDYRKKHDKWPQELDIPFLTDEAYMVFSGKCDVRDNELSLEAVWPPNRIEAKVRSTIHKATDGGLDDMYDKVVLGARSAKATLTPAPAKVIYTPDEPLNFTMFHDIQPSLEARDFVEGLLCEGEMSVVFGPPGCGKTFFVSDMCLHIASGKTYMEATRPMATEQGGVLYMSLEGNFGIKNRIHAFKQFHSMEEHVIPFGLTTGKICLLEDETVEATIKMLESFQKVTEVPTRILVVDTLSRAMRGGDENNSVDMTTLIANVDRIREATSTHILLVHHCGKDKNAGARGHSSLKGAMDTEIKVHPPEWDEEAGLWSPYRAEVTKQKDMEIPAPIEFNLTSLALGINHRGKEVTSCVVTPSQAEIYHEEKVSSFRKW